MGSSLRDRLKAKAGETPAPQETAEAAAPQQALEAEAVVYEGSVVDVIESIEQIEIEAVVGGALQRIRFAGGVNPAEVRGMLMSLDPGVKVRDAFPSKFGGGNRETKLARCLVLTLRVTDAGKFIDLVCQNGEDLTVSVSKKSSDTFLDQLKALGKLHDKSLAKVEKCFAEKGQATVILGDDEQFGAKYWTTDDGKSFLDSMQPDAPAVVENEE